jgi:acyl-coenzyme A thioesterase PaaI-like protein
MASTTGEPGALLDILGFRRWVEMEDGRATGEFMAGLHMCHSGGVVQGGFVTGWIDCAMAYAVYGLGLPDVTPMSLELKISFFAPVRPGLVFAEAWIERRGKSTCFTEGVLRDADGAVLAKATSTMRLVSMAKVAEASRAALGGA